MKKIILFLIIFMCTGCFNYKELNELGIVSALGISKENDEFLVDLQITNILESGENGLTESPITVISGKGKTVFEAIRSLNLKSSKVFFSPDVEYIIIDKSIVKDDLKEVIDFMARDTKLTLNFLILTSTDNTPKDILSSLSQFNTSSALNVSNIIKLSESRYGGNSMVTFLDYLKSYLEEGITPVYPNITINGSNETGSDTENLKDSNSNNYVELKNLVTFNNEGKLINLDKDSSLGYNFLKNKILNASITVKCDDDYFTVETLKSDFKYSKVKNNNMNISGNVSGEIVYYGCKENLNDDKALNKMTLLFNNEIKRVVNKTINLAKTEKTDFIGIGNYIYKNQTNYFDFEKRNWNKEGLSNLSFSVDVKGKIFKQGNLKGDIND